LVTWRCPLLTSQEARSARKSGGFSSPTWNEKPAVSRLSVERFHIARKRRNHFENVSDNAIVCESKDRSFRILIDCDDNLGVYHSDTVLNSARNASGNVKSRRHGAPCLSNLV